MVHEGRKTGMKKQEFDQMKKTVEKNIQEVCEKNPRMEDQVVIAAITEGAGVPGERNFTESQLRELFDLADEHRRKEIEDVLKTQSV